MRSGSQGRAPARGPRDPVTGIVVLLLGLFLAVRYGDVISVPFINDDYIFLDKTRAASFGSLWAPEALAFHWYRPWSREFHYWALQRLFGAHELPFHLASLAIALVSFTAFYLLARRLAGARAAAVAVAGAATMAAWGVPVVWVAGVQELWLLAFALAFLHAVASGSRWGTAVALVLGLVSKETSAVLPGIAVAYLRWVEGRPWRESLRRVLPLAAIVAAWALFHPVLGGRLWRPLNDPIEPGLHPVWARIALQTVAVPLNLDGFPAPESGWLKAMARSVPGAVALALLAGWVTRRAPAPPEARARVVRFGLAWAAVGWLPLWMPTLGWHAYYGLLGALGAWLALGAALARRPVLAVAAVVALALLGGARADTPSRDWGSEWYQRRAASFIGFMRADLRRLVPDPPPHTRMYFVRVPSNVGFLAGDAPALRVWYGDPTLRGGYYPSYRHRGPGETAGRDDFFRYDSTSGWIPVRRGPEDVAEARRANPRWIIDHQVLARTLANGGDWPGAAAEYEKLAAADSSSVDFAYNAGVCREALGDSTRAGAWYRRAASLPGADAEVQDAARRTTGHRQGRGGPGSP